MYGIYVDALYLNNASKKKTTKENMLYGDFSVIKQNIFSKTKTKIIIIVHKSIGEMHKLNDSLN